MRFSLTPLGPFGLANASSSFGGWPAPASDPAAIAIAFPLERSDSSAAVVVREDAAGLITGEVHGAKGEEESAWQQALAVLSLDVDGRAFPRVGARDPVAGKLQEKYAWLRPVLFHSPYEAAANFVIGQRSSIKQARAIRAAMAARSGDAIPLGGEELRAFPRPEVLAKMKSFPGLSAEKIRRLHAVADAAKSGLLDRARLRALPADAALAELREIHGVGAFSAQGILFRGAGLVDAITDDPVTAEALQRAYGLARPPDHEAALAIAEKWRPFRMWTLVLFHVWLRREGGGPTRSPRGKPATRRT